MRRAALLLALALPLAACGSADDPGTGGVTSGEARALDQAAAATDINATPEAANTTEQ